MQVTLTSVRGTAISDTQALALVNPLACRVRFSATGAQTHAPQCMSYYIISHRFFFNWLVPITGATGPTTATVTYPYTTTTTARSQSITVTGFR